MLIALMLFFILIEMDRENRLNKESYLRLKKAAKAQSDAAEEALSYMRRSLHDEYLCSLDNHK